MSKSSLVPSRLKRTLFSVFCGRGLVVLRQLLLIPIMLRAWGVEYYGAWLVLSAIPSFLTLSNLGLGTSACMKIAVDVAAGRGEEAWEALVTSLWIIFAIGLIAVIGAFGWIHWWHSNQLDAGLIENPPLVLTILVANLFVSMLNEPMLGWWNGVGKPSVGIHLLNIASLGNLVLSVAIPLLGGRALLLSSMILLWSLLWLAGFSIKSYGLIRESALASRRNTRPNWQLGKRLAGTGIGHELSPLWQAVLFQGSLVLANSFLGPAGAALWGTLRTATRSGNQAMELISQSMGPEFQLALGENDRVKLRRLHSVGLVSGLLLSLFMASVLLVLGPYVFGLWTHHAFTVPQSVWWVMSLSLIPFALWWVSGEFQRSINQPWFLNIWALFAAALSVGCMAVGGRFGIISFAVGALVFEVCMAGIALPRSLRLLDDHFVAAITRGFAILWERSSSARLRLPWSKNLGRSEL